MGEETSQPAAQADPGSATWQPDAISQHQSEISNFLDTQFSAPTVRQAAERTLTMLQLESGQSVLDVGCGTGLFLSLLARAVGPDGRAVGVDLSSAFVTETQARIAAEGLEECASVVEGDAYALPFETGSFDAARCERLLMHLEDPTAALREMRRVVRPGGRVAATEPDWAALTLDHPDPEIFALLYERFLRRFRQPRMGRSLYRHFHEAGFVRRQVTPIYSVQSTIDFLRLSGVDLHHQAERLVAEGAVNQERAEAAVAYLDAASETGTFFAGGAYFVVSGHAPDA